MICMATAYSIYSDALSRASLCAGAQELPRSREPTCCHDSATSLKWPEPGPKRSEGVPGQKTQEKVNTNKKDSCRGTSKTRDQRPSWLHLRRIRGVFRDFVLSMHPAPSSNSYNDSYMFCIALIWPRFLKTLADMQELTLKRWHLSGMQNAGKGWVVSPVLTLSWRAQFMFLIGLAGKNVQKFCLGAQQTGISQTPETASVFSAYCFLHSANCCTSSSYTV